jgi:glycopeptidolipid biosynthesis protein
VDDSFFDLGGDSLKAMQLVAAVSTTLDVELGVQTLFDAPSVAALSQHLDKHERGSGRQDPADENEGEGLRPTLASVHGRGATEAHASDLTLDKFLDEATLQAAPALPRPSAEASTVLLTGATGFLGRYLALEWLRRMDQVDGKLICLVRGKSNEDAWRRLEETFNSGDPDLLRHFRELAADHLEVIAGDKGRADLGLDAATWQRLADTVDLIVDPAALVNGILPYRELFGPNVVGTAELIRLALTTKLKPFAYVSTANVGDHVEPSAFTEDADIRAISPSRKIDNSYTNGYGNSKWAGEVLLREAHDLCGLPVTVFRCDMILAGTSYSGQLNMSDLVTRMMLSLVATGIAPRSFYELDATGNRQRAHFDALPVEFVAEAIATLGARAIEGHQTYHVMNPHDDGIGVDEFVDWLIEAGTPIQRIDDFGEWLHRFKAALLALPDRQREQSVLQVLMLRFDDLHAAEPVHGSLAPTDRFRAAVREAEIGRDNDIPHVSAAVITKYVNDMKLLGLL